MTSLMAPTDVGLAYIGQVTRLEPVARADRLLQADVDCGPGGRWRGVVAKDEAWGVGDLARVFLQDARLPETAEFEFLRKYHFRVRMQKLRGAASEVLILPLLGAEGDPGTDITAAQDVRRYAKPAPEGTPLAGAAFPSWLPKTDEPNFQRVPHLVQAVAGVPVYVTLKLDGSSMTVYRHEGVVHVCSRNTDLFEGDDVFWRTAVRMGLTEAMPEGFAIQGELVGPKIQGNPLGLPTPCFFAFQVFDIGNRRYLDERPFLAFCDRLMVPPVPTLYAGLIETSDDALRALAEQAQYPGGAPGEGVVVRPCVEQTLGDDRVSFKVLNLNYAG